MLLIFSICCKDTYFTNRVNYNGIEYFYRVYAIGCTKLFYKHLKKLRFISLSGSPKPSDREYEPAEQKAKHRKRNRRTSMVGVRLNR